LLLWSAVEVGRVTGSTYTDLENTKILLIDIAIVVSVNFIARWIGRGDIGPGTADLEDGEVVLIDIKITIEIAVSEFEGDVNMQITCAT
jgi:hypothetical protein